jgi:hypothetical protein
MMSRSAPALLLLALAACSDRPLPTAGPAPEASLSRAADRGTVREKGRYQVAMLDNCGGPTWAGFGGCEIQGAVSRPAFQASLAAIGYHPDWRNDPASLDVKWNAKLLVTNEGGRDHTFTRVAAFGGGYVPGLNRLPDTRTIAPECAVPRPEEIVEPGAAIEVRTDHGGHVGDHDERYQCCIHPWMRTTVHVRHRAPR